LTDVFTGVHAIYARTIESSVYLGPASIRSFCSCSVFIRYSVIGSLPAVCKGIS